jgi:hypothetical protein
MCKDKGENNLKIGWISKFGNEGFVNGFSNSNDHPLQFVESLAPSHTATATKACTFFPEG